MSAYPKIMRHGKDGVIVEFTASKIGTVIGSGNMRNSLPRLNIGHKSTTWNMYVFSDYKPEIHGTKK